MGEHLRARRVGASTLVAVLLAALLTAVGTVATPAPARAAGPGTLTLAAGRGMVVDPGTGRVFVAGDDAVEVLAPDGTTVGKVPNIYGATALDAATGSIWVTEANAGAFAQIDATTLAVVRTYALGTTVGDSIAIVGNAAFVNTGTSLGQVDLTTGALTPVTSVYAKKATRIPGTTAEVLVWGSAGGSLQRISTTAPFPVVTSGSVDSYMSGLAFSPDGSRLFTAMGFPYSFVENLGSTLASTGSRYLADAYPRLVTTSPGHGGMLAGFSDGVADLVWTYRPGTPYPIGRVQISTGNSVGATSLGLSPDGDTAYVLRGNSPSVVSVVDLHPALTAVAPTSVVRDVPTPITLTGRSLGATTSVTIGGVPAVVTSTAPDKVVVILPAGVPTGTQVVSVTGPTGTASTSITVQANTGATLQGSVSKAGSPVAGAGLTLSGGPLATPRTFSSAADGSYQTTGLAHGTTYTLTVHDPGGAPDQVIRNITLTPNQTTTLAVDVARPVPNGYELRRTTLGGPLVRDLVVHPTSGRIAVAVNDEVDVLDRDGALLARLTGLFDSRSLARNGNDVYVGSARLSRITRIDLTTLTVTGSWPLGRVTNGSIAFAGGRVWFVNGDNQWTSLASLDPATGTVVDGYWSLYVPMLRSVDGDPNRFVASELGISSSPTHLFDGTTTTPVQVAAIDTFTGPSPGAPVAPVATNDRLYDSRGDEYVLSTLRTDGVHYGTNGLPAHSAGHGGVVAFGSSVFRAGTPSATHVFPGGATTATGLDPTGARLYRVQDDQLTVDDLTPTVTGTVPATITPLQTTFDLEGTGFGDATAVTLDGNPVAFTIKDPSHLTLAAPAPGLHQVVVTSSWGTSAPAPVLAIASTVPAAPTGVTATRVGPKVRVSWTPPALNGGLPITSYVASTQGAGGGSCSTSTGTTCDIAGLTPGATYSITVTAHNANGNSAPSSPPLSYFMAYPTVPGAPTGVSAVAGAGNATISWTPPADGGAAMTSTRVNAYLDGTVPVLPAVTVPWTDSSVVYGGLTPGQRYTFTVTASNTVGDGPASPPTTPVTILAPTGPPGPPGTPTAVAGSTEATVSWSPPTTTNGAPITSYLVTASPGGRWCSTVLTSCTVTGLTNGTAHTFTVVAVNAFGDGPASPPSAPVTPVAPGGHAFHPLPPARILDSRPESQVGPHASPWATGQTRAVTVTGAGGVPTSATAVALNVTVTGTRNPGFATVWPAGQPQPVASSINWGGGDTLANAVTTRVGTGGQVEVFVAGGPVDIIFDVVGYYDDQPGDGLVPITPQRILDSRPDSQVGPYGSAWGPGTSRSVTVAGAGGVPADADAVVLNATVTGTTAAGFLTLSPSGQPRPLASTLNWAAGQTIPNAVTVKVGTGGAIDVFNNSGQAHVIFDVAGYYTPGTGALFHPISPVRTEDSRPSSQVGPYATPWGPATSRSIVVRDGTVVPDAAVAVLHNVTVTTTSAASFLSLWPGDQSMPLVSSLNWPAGRTTANQVTSSIGSTGSLWVYNSAGTADVITDVDGWFG